MSVPRAAVAASFSALALLGCTTETQTTGSQNEVPAVLAFDATAADPAPVDLVVRDVGSIDVYSGPSRLYTSVAVVSAGDAVVGTGRQTTEDGSDDRWTEVVVDTQTGWVPAFAVELADA